MARSLPLPGEIMDDREGFLDYLNRFFSLSTGGGGGESALKQIVDRLPLNELVEIIFSIPDDDPRYERLKNALTSDKMWKERFAANNPFKFPTIQPIGRNKNISNMLSFVFGEFMATVFSAVAIPQQVGDTQKVFDFGVQIQLKTKQAHYPWLYFIFKLDQIYQKPPAALSGEKDIMLTTIANMIRLPVFWKVKNGLRHVQLMPSNFYEYNVDEGRWVYDNPYRWAYGEHDSYSEKNLALIEEEYKQFAKNHKFDSEVFVGGVDMSSVPKQYIYSFFAQTFNNPVSSKFVNFFRITSFYINVFKENISFERGINWPKAPSSLEFTIGVSSIDIQIPMLFHYKNGVWQKKTFWFLSRYNQYVDENLGKGYKIFRVQNPSKIKIFVYPRAPVRLLNGSDTMLYDADLSKHSITLFSDNLFALRIIPVKYADQKDDTVSCIYGVERTTRVSPDILPTQSRICHTCDNVFFNKEMFQCGNQCDTYYCGQECANEHWKTHKEYCGVGINEKD